MPILGNYITSPVTGMQDSASAISKGQACVLNSVTDGTKVIVAATNNLAKALFIALEDSPGQNREFRMGKAGDIVWAKASGAITQGDKLMSAAANGGVMTVGAVSGTVYHVIAIALETAADGNFVAVLMAPGSHQAA